MIQLRAIAALCFLLLLSASAVHAQSSTAYPHVTTSIEPTSGTVGERFRLNITARVPDLQALQVMPLFDTQTTWTAMGDPQISDSKTGNDDVRSLTYTVVPFETGKVEIPRVALTYAPAGSTSSTVLSEPLWVEVNSVLSGNGSASALRDVKPPVPLPVPPAVIWTGGIFVAAVLAFLGYLLWRRYASSLQGMLGRALTPPELALKEMDTLEQERLIEHKKIKEYYTRLSDTIRHYLHAAYGVDSVDLTSNELLREMDHLTQDQPANQADNYRHAMARLVELLDEADLVKFARVIPEPARCRKAIQAGREIVQLTTYRFAPPEEPDQNDAGSRRAGPRPPAPPSSSPAVHAEVS